MQPPMEPREAITQSNLHSLASQNWPDDIKVGRKSQWLGKIFSHPKELDLNEVAARIESFIQSTATLDGQVVEDLLIIEHRLEVKKVNTSSLHKLIIEKSNKKKLNLIVLKEKETSIEIPKTSLTLKSSYFNTMLNSTFKESNLKQIQLYDDSDEAIPQVLNFIKEGTVELTETNVFHVLEAADKYMLNQLTEKCLDWIDENISNNAYFKFDQENFETLLEISVKYDLPYLSAKIKRYFEIKLGEINKVYDFIDLLKSAPSDNFNTLYNHLQNIIIAKSNLERDELWGLAKKHNMPLVKKAIIDNQIQYVGMCPHPRKPAEEEGKKITDLNIFKGFNLTSEMDKTPEYLTPLDWIEKEGKNFTELQLLGKYNLTSDQMKFIIQHCPSLKSLSFVCLEINDKFVEEIMPYIKNVSALEFFGCDLLTDEAIDIIGKNAKNLKSLDLSLCNNLTDETARIISENLKNLTYIALKGCNKISGLAKKDLKNKLESIHGDKLKFVSSVLDFH